MSLNIDEVAKIARLSQLEFQDSELADIGSSLSKILDYIDEISSLDTDSTSPLQHPLSDQKQRMRTDVVSTLDNKQKALNLSTDSSEDFFVVPQVIEQKSK